MMVTITLLVAITLYAIYYYDKMYSNSQRQLIIKKYLKTDLNELKDKVNKKSAVNTTTDQGSSTGTKDTATAHKDHTVQVILNDIVENGALIMEEDHLHKMITGDHKWELRTTKFKKSGYIGLVKKGSKQVCAYAKIAGYHGPLSKDELKKHKSKHGVLAKEYNAKDFKRVNAIELADVHELSPPIAYEHKPGAVIWVKIGEQDDVVEALRAQL